MKRPFNARCFFFSSWNLKDLYPKDICCMTTTWQSINTLINIYIYTLLISKAKCSIPINFPTYPTNIPNFFSPFCNIIVFNLSLSLSMWRSLVLLPLPLTAYKPLWQRDLHHYKMAKNGSPPPQNNISLLLWIFVSIFIFYFFQSQDV